MNMDKFGCYLIKQKAVRNLLPSRLGDRTLQLVLCSCSGQFDLNTCWAQQVAFAQDLGSRQETWNKDLQYTHQAEKMTNQS